MNEFISIDILLTLAGCVALTSIATQACKMYITAKIDPKWYTLIFSAIFVAARQTFIVQDFTGEGWFMTAVNVVVCLLSAVGTFETLGKALEKIAGVKK